jgi:hypothetical protein
VRRASAFDAVDHTAGTDRIAVAALEIRPADGVRHCAHTNAERPGTSTLDGWTARVFSSKTRAWFEEAFDGPTPAQTLGWPAIASGKDTLIQAPTGSGKTLAAFLYGIDKLNSEPGEGLRLIYVSPLKALNYDIERNLRGPLAGLQSELRIGVRTGDTPQKERAAMLRTARHPDHDAGVAVPHAHFSRAREPEGCPHADPRRGPCRRRH